MVRQIFHKNRDSSLTFLLQFVHIRKGFLCPLFTDAAVKSLMFPLDQSALWISFWSSHTYAMAKFIWRTRALMLILSVSSWFTWTCFVFVWWHISGKLLSSCSITSVTKTFQLLHCIFVTYFIFFLPYPLFPSPSFWFFLLNSHLLPLLYIGITIMLPHWNNLSIIASRL